MTEVEEPRVGVPEDAHEDPQFQQIVDEVFNDAQARGTLEEPREVTREVYEDESAKTYIGREFTIDEFARWYAVQRLGGRPFNAIGYHHTWSPTSSQWAGMGTVKGIYNYYHDQLGWRPWGKGPHLWIYSGEGRYQNGTPLVYVGTHPAHDGYGIAGSNATVRNGRWLHIEHAWNGDQAPFSDAMKRISGQVLAVVCGPNQHTSREIPLTFIRDSGVNNPSRPLGIMYHRDENVNWRPGAWPKSCPGLKVSHENLDADVFRYAREYRGGGTGPKPTEPCVPSAPPAFDGSDKTINNVVFHAAKQTVEVAANGLRRRQWATTDSCQLGESLKKGATFQALYWVEGEKVDGEKRWWIADDGARIWMGGTVQKA